LVEVEDEVVADLVVELNPLMHVAGTRGAVVTKQRHGGIMQSYLFLNQMIRN
jgi:hypothetical protein